MSTLAIILLFLNIGLLILGYMYAIKGILNAENEDRTELKERILPALGTKSYGFALLALFIGVLISLVY